MTVLTYFATVPLYKKPVLLTVTLLYEEIDLVATNYHTNEILFGEVKWSNKQVGTNIYEDLKKKAQAVEWGKKGRKEYFAIFSKSGFTKDMAELAEKDKVFLVHKDKLLGF